MKTYNKNQYLGNINKWGDDFKTLSSHSMPESIAEELNKQFDSTGVKYEEVKEEKAKVQA